MTKKVSRKKKSRTLRLPDHVLNSREYRAIKKAYVRLATQLNKGVRAKVTISVPFFINWDGVEAFVNYELDPYDVHELLEAAATRSEPFMRQAKKVSAFNSRVDRFSKKNGVHVIDVWNALERNVRSWSQ